MADPTFTTREALDDWARVQILYREPGRSGLAEAHDTIRRVKQAHAHLLATPTKESDRDE